MGGRRGAFCSVAIEGKPPDLLALCLPLTLLLPHFLFRLLLYHTPSTAVCLQLAPCDKLFTRVCHECDCPNRGVCVWVLSAMHPEQGLSAVLYSLAIEGGLNSPQQRTLFVPARVGGLFNGKRELKPYTAGLLFFRLIIQQLPFCYLVANM